MWNRYYNVRYICFLIFRYYYNQKRKFFIHPFGNHVSSVEDELFGVDEEEEEDDELQPPVLNKLNPSSLMVWLIVVGMMVGMAGMIAFMAGLFVPSSPIHVFRKWKTVYVYYTFEFVKVYII